MDKITNPIDEQYFENSLDKKNAKIGHINKVIENLSTPTPTPTPNLGPVLDNIITDPSILTPEEGDRYIVPTNAINDWLGQDNNIAQWVDFAQDWTYYIPVDEDKTIVTTGSNAGNVYEFNGISWIEVIVPIANNTPFVLAGTAIDAGGDKTSRIARTGDVLIGSTNSSLNAKLAINGKTIANAYATRTGFASTSDITRTGKWYRIMSFDCNYSIYATHHHKILLSFNGNSNGAGFVAELDIQIKRQNTQIFVSSVIRQSINTAEIVYDENDRNIEFLWNNTTKRVTLYFRPDQNYSALSLTMLNPRETANTRFSFLNQYTNATDLTGEISDALTEKNIIMGDVIGVNFTTPILKRRILNESSNDYSQFIQNSQLFGLSAAYGDGSYEAQYIFSPQQFSFGISDKANSVTNNVLSGYSSNNYYLSDNLNNITNQIEQSISSNRLNISDSNNNTTSTYEHNTTNFRNNITDSNNSLVSDFFIGSQEIYLTNEDQLNGKGKGIQLLANDELIIRNLSNSGEINTNIQLLPDNLQLVCYDETGGNSEKTTVNQTNKDLTLRFEDTNLGVDNTIEFNKTQLVLPDGYNIYSDLQNTNPDIITSISVGDSNSQGQAIRLITADTTNGEGFVITQNTTSYTINSLDYVITYFAIEPTSNLVAIRSTGNILMSDLPIYADDVAADADVDLLSGCLYKLTGSRAVYQKP